MIKSPIVGREWNRSLSRSFTDIINRVSASEESLLSSLSSPLSFDCDIGKISNCSGRIMRASRTINKSLILNCNNREALCAL